MRIIVWVLVMLIAANCYAEVKLFKFVKANKVIGVTYSDNDGNVTTPTGSTAIEITESQKDAAIAQQKADMPIQFSYAKLLYSINLKFTGMDAITLAPYLGALQGYCEAANWVGLKAFTQGLVQAQILDQAGYVKLNDSLKEQGIDLDII